LEGEAENVKSHKVKLRLIGITFSQVQAGAYALILAENEGTRRVPIMIGTPEAQSIAIFLEQLRPPRPITHDLFVSLIKTLNISIKEVFIHKYEEGVFFSELIFNDGTKEIRLDSRTSDAIAIAVRANADIFITETIMKEVSIELQDDEIMDEMEDASHKTDLTPDKMNRDELRKALDEAIAMENYEKASSIRDMINKLK
jgi:bifunctional DNase/RNase